VLSTNAVDKARLGTIGPASAHVSMPWLPGSNSGERQPLAGFTERHLIEFYVGSLHDVKDSGCLRVRRDLPPVLGVVVRCAPYAGNTAFLISSIDISYLIVTLVKNLLTCP